MKYPREILENSSYFWSMKIYVFLKINLFCNQSSLTLSTKVACFINKKNF